MRLVPGDLLCYAGTGLLSRLVRVKTWSPISHVELYADLTWNRHRTLGARERLGVRYFDLRTDDLHSVLRPSLLFNVAAGRAWFDREAVGQDYDWWGLLRFFTIGAQSHDKQFCSEVVTRVYRHGGFEPFARTIDADLVAPGTFRYSPFFTTHAPAAFGL